jgi:hypothetical protein
MKLIGANDQAFELRILGYEFPEIEDDKYDSNWLIIEVEVNHPKGSWIARDASLLTYEVDRLGRWLENIANNQQVNPLQSFMEPNLEFIFISPESPSKVLRIYFELELRPSWAPYTGIMQDLWVEFQVSKLDLQQAALSLWEQLSKYPQRAIE